MPRRLLVQRLWCHAQVSGPDDGAELLVDADLREPRLIARRLEHPAPLVVTEGDVSHGAVFESQAHPMLANDFDVRDVNERGHLSHAIRC